MSAWFIKRYNHRKPHVISQGLKSSLGTIYQTACGQIVRYRSDSDESVVFEAGMVPPDEVCGICRQKTKQALA